jgi:hypothetical protein
MDRRQPPGRQVEELRPRYDAASLKGAAADNLVDNKKRPMSLLVASAGRILSGIA